MKIRFKLFGWAVLLTVGMITGCIGFLSPGWLFLVEVISHYVFLVLAGLLLAVRFANFITRENFVYILIGTINLGMGIGAFLYYWNHINPALPIMMSINFALGTILLVDALFLKRKIYEQNLS